MSLTRWIFIPGVALVAALSVHVAVADELADGEAFFQARCSDCHGSPNIAEWVGQWSDPADRRAQLAELLEKHYPPPEDERQAIIDFLIAAVRSE